MVARKGISPVLKELRLVDEVLEVEKNNSDSYSKALVILNNQIIDHVICPHKSFRSGLFVRKLNVKGEKIGFQKWWTPLVFTRTRKYPQSFPDAIRQLSLLGLLDKNFDDKWRKQLSREVLKVPLRKSGPLKMNQFLIPEWSSMKLDHNFQKKCDNTVVLAPGSVWATKKWTLQGYIEVARHFVSQGLKVQLMGSPAEKELCDQIFNSVPQVLNQAGETSLMQSLQILSSAKLLVCNDSGAMHLAAAAGVPTVAIFGPTTLDIGYQPWNENSVVIQKDIPCRPCGKHGPQVCPLGTHECMKTISSSEVIQSAEELMKTRTA